MGHSGASRSVVRCRTICFDVEYFEVERNGQKKTARDVSRAVRSKSNGYSIVAFASRVAIGANFDVTPAASRAAFARGDLPDAFVRGAQIGRLQTLLLARWLPVRVAFVALRRSKYAVRCCCHSGNLPNVRGTFVVARSATIERIRNCSMYIITQRDATVQRFRAENRISQKL
jgi:hypothetical protein